MWVQGLGLRCLGFGAHARYILLVYVALCDAFVVLENERCMM